ncbi:MAG: RNA polymerase sigma factor [Verrucomicrobiota bacterium]
MSSPKSKEAQWFEEEVRPHDSSLRAYLQAAFPSLPDLDDLVQETYLRLIRAKERGPISYAKAFLFTTARNAALDLFRRRKIVSFEPVDDFKEWPLLDEKPDASEALNQQQELAMLAEAIKGLPTRCRQTVTLRVVYGLPAKEIASRLGISECTAKAQLARGLRRCAQYFQEHGLMPAPADTEK